MKTRRNLLSDHSRVDQLEPRVMLAGEAEDNPVTVVDQWLSHGSQPDQDGIYELPVKGDLFLARKVRYGFRQVVTDKGQIYVDWLFWKNKGQDKNILATLRTSLPFWLGGRTLGHAIVKEIGTIESYMHDRVHDHLAQLDFQFELGKSLGNPGTDGIAFNNDSGGRERLLIRPKKDSEAAEVLNYEVHSALNLASPLVQAYLGQGVEVVL